MVPAVLGALKLGVRRMDFLIDEDLPELDFIDLEIIYVSSLKDVIGHLTAQWSPTPIKKSGAETSSLVKDYLDFQQIIGQNEAKHALEVAAAGEHHVLMTGPPG